MPQARAKLWQAGAAVLLVAVGFTAANGLRRQTMSIAQVGPPAQEAPVRQVVLTRRPSLAVAFRLDPDITRGLFLGDRWVSPPSYFFAQPGRQYVVQAKAQDVDSRGERTDVSGDWVASDPDMVAVTRRDTGEVTIVVRRPGESDLAVTAGNSTRRLHIRASQLPDAMQVQITQ